MIHLLCSPLDETPLPPLFLPPTCRLILPRTLGFGLLALCIALSSLEPF